jgi:hypothetical protein
MSGTTQTTTALVDAIGALEASARGDVPPPAAETIERLLLLAVGAAAANWEEADRVPELALGDDLSPTAVARVAGALLQAADMELFELALWQMWGSNQERGQR